MERGTGIGWAAILIAICFRTDGLAVEPRVLVIGIDGAGGRFLRDANTPNIDALITKGAVNYQFLNEGALITSPPSGYGASGVNWSTITTGASAAHHGVTDNSFGGAKFDQFPHFFSYVKQHDPTAYTASIVNWGPINDQILADSYADWELQNVSDVSVRDAAVSLLQSGDPDAIFLHFDQVDAAGHASGWGSPQHTTAIQNVDALIGPIMVAVSARPGVMSGAEDWLVLVTADHGGEGTSHFAGQGLVNWEVPFIVSGNQVPAGHVLPQGTLRDVATTALWHLGVDPFTTKVDGRVRGLAFGAPNGMEGDVNQDGVISGDGTGPASQDDVTAFVMGWRTTGHRTRLAAYQHGDLNLDRTTDLRDWILLRRLAPELGAAARSLLTVPEPTSPMASGMAMLLFARRTRRRSASNVPI